MPRVSPVARMLLRGAEAGGLRGAEMVALGQK